MLDKNDEKKIREIMVDTLGEFFEKSLAPYLDEEHKQNQKDHQEIRQEMYELRSEIVHVANDHEKRIDALEKVTGI